MSLSEPTLLFQSTPGDRIAILSNGALVCCGSFEYLKNRFGKGHHLTLVLSPQGIPSQEDSQTIVLRANVAVESSDHTPSALPSSSSPSTTTLPLPLPHPLPPLAPRDFSRHSDFITHFIRVSGVCTLYYYYYVLCACVM